MLPSFAELGGSTSRDDDAKNSPSPLCDPFDEASFGIWATIMDNPDEATHATTEEESRSLVKSGQQTRDENGVPMIEPFVDKPVMSVHRRERLEEFCSAFLEMSLFDVSDVWMPIEGAPYGTLGHVTSNTCSSSDANSALNDFTLVSQYSQIKIWSGAVGRAFASGNPVWSANYVRRHVQRLTRTLDMFRFLPMIHFFL